MTSMGRRFSVAAALTLLWASATLAQEMPVPTQMQASLFAKILTFERNLKARAGKELRIGVLYQKKVRSSLRPRRSSSRRCAGTRVGGSMG